MTLEEQIKQICAHTDVLGSDEMMAELAELIREREVKAMQMYHQARLKGEQPK